ncbi:hypothetical protein QT937_021880 [Xanthomonas campestris pv. campestris]|uniref:hypothetical protein n=1 Tax=Xanthomonas campestris TaxID=339 RepID=UPI0025A1A4AC|nr:hypothetical protein [Xanthomonas campestris]MDM7697892.1 hypothetical protein [Xanthomonas campestris pv. campestris]
MPKPQSHLAKPSRSLIEASGASDNSECVSLALEEFSRIASSPSVSSVKLALNKKSGVIKLTARGANNQVMTREILGPGLEVATRYDGAKNKKHHRDANIHTLLNRGLTQAEVAEQLGCSQALVSRVKNSS